MGWIDRCRHEESGAILVITAILLVVILGFTALAVDTGSLYQARQHAQNAADAAALQGADDLAAGDSAGQAQTDAQAMGTTNYGGSTVTADATGTTVTVTVNASTPTFFGRIFGATSENVSARAVAAAGQSSTACTPSGSTGNCYAIFAMSTSCSPPALSISGGSYTINGGMHSNGGITPGGGGSAFGPTTYGSTCSAPSGGGSYVSGPTSQAAVTSYPIDYRTLYPACSSSGPIYCTGPNGTPSYCTYAASSYTITSAIGGSSTGIYCAYGSGTVSNPATWTGAVNLNNGGYSVTASFICGTFTAGSLSSPGLTPYSGAKNNLAVYAAATSGTAINIGGGGFQVTGTLFAPSAQASINAGITGSNFIEANTVSLNAGGYSVTGDGPSDTTSGSASSISSLMQ